ncbi:predicted protein [Aspergillus terreus NIH2624]|uniref:Uncharacterized protein n=1 Tax=Aspergillus terreus (strain NIH 2624 / FGSC A1156) TaxID=341663 RepID=Q0CGC6_ASPTN|nr:uncharacterized protein ATEG_07266 [Aspergillus terreus NIH2624]EAU32650.1 predicted protein [Aspergillus terreus NIH2624]
MVQDLLRRHRDCPDDPDPDPTTGIRREPTDASSSVKSSDANTRADSPRPTKEKPKAKAKAHSEHVESRPKKADVKPSASYQLTKEDAETLFSGAPYFLLEKGKHGHYYPQVIFPFDDHDPSIQNLWDRRPLPHPAYTICTLHAHLPVPDKWVIEGDAPVYLNRWKRTGAPKRATFDIGIFETPNMLGNNGKDPGTIGFRTYLELPVGDAVRYVGPERPRPIADYMHLSAMPAAEVYDLMEHYNDPYSLCQDGTVHDRKRLLCDGPSAWRRIGVRDIDLRTLVERLQFLTTFRYEILHSQKTTTILDKESCRELYTGLFTRFLYPPSHFMLVGVDNPHSLKVQIKALTTVLGTPGAWINFCLPEWRLRVGQILWEAAPHVDGDFLNPNSCDKPWMHPTLERKWLLVQMLLSAELLLRLDATVRVGILDSSSNLHVSARDMQDFDRLRNDQVDWCLVTVRRFMDAFGIAYRADEPEPPRTASSMSLHSLSHEKNDKGEKPRHHHRWFEALTHRSSSPSLTKLHVESAWRCHLTPSHVEVQIQGLTVFAEAIGWPGARDLRAHLRSKLEAENSTDIIADAFSQPMTPIPLGETDVPFEKDEMYSRSLSRRRILLHDASASDKDPHQIGGWITRSWLSGFVAPGELINHLLMATVLENDPAARATLGRVANLYGGFAYRGRSYWSQECIVGRVLCCLEGARACLGWSSSAVVPRDSQTFEPLDNTWFEVSVVAPPGNGNAGKPRIKHGNKLSYESTPLGLGDLTSGAYSLPVDAPLDEDASRIRFDSLTFSGKEAHPLEGRPQVVAHKTSMSFSLTTDAASPDGAASIKVSFPLTYNVRFVASHECRPPGGFVSYQGQTPPTPLHHHRLPGHPLHRTYGYKFVPIAALRGSHSQELFFGNIGVGRYEVMVVDARGSREKEAFARAWCASAGYDAIIGREKRTCLACCIREARAISVKVVIRTGGGLSRPTSIQTV